MTMPLTFKTPKPRAAITSAAIAPLRLLLRPIFFLVLGLHALALFVPLPQAEVPKEANDKKDPVRITQIPTANLTPPLPTTKQPAKGTGTAATVANTPGKPATASSGSPSATGTSASSSLPVVQSGSSFAANNSGTTALPSTPTTPLPPGTSAATPSPSPDVDPEAKLFEMLAKIPVPDESDPASTNQPSRDQFDQPDLFFVASTEEAGEPQWNPALKGTPVIAMGESPDYFYETSFEGELKGAFETMEKVGTFAGGSLYALKRGSYQVYASLIPLKMPPGTVGIGTIISVWSQDPRKPVENQP
jgi:hypothetical protein